jgi:hypothetical protein
MILWCTCEDTVERERECRVGRKGWQGREQTGKMK